MQVQTAFDQIKQGAGSIPLLFQPVNFFKLYKNFLEVQLTAKVGGMKSFSAYVNSQLRKFIEKLHHFSESQGMAGNGFLDVAHPCTETFSLDSMIEVGGPNGGQERALFFLGLKFCDEVVKKVSATLAGPYPLPVELVPSHRTVTKEWCSRKKADLRTVTQQGNQMPKTEEWW